MAEGDDEQNIVQKTGRIYAAVFSIFGSVLVCLAIGWALDRWLGTSPWLVVAGIVVGSAVGFYEFIRNITKIT